MDDIEQLNETMKHLNESMDGLTAAFSMHTEMALDHRARLEALITVVQAMIPQHLDIPEFAECLRAQNDLRIASLMAEKGSRNLMAIYLPHLQRILGSSASLLEEP